jgi:hypothetical protein
VCIDKQTSHHAGEDGVGPGIWYSIRQVIRGLLAHDEGGLPRVYGICEPSSHYHQIMVRHESLVAEWGTAASKWIAAYGCLRMSSHVRSRGPLARLLLAIRLKLAYLLNLR